MITELRCAKRITDYLPIMVTAQNGISGKMLAGPFSCRIIDISKSGACLLMTQVMSNTYHIFHSTRERDSFCLKLTVNIPPEIVNFSLSARPIWLDVFHQEEIRAFKMGVEFIINPEGAQMKRLQKALKKQQKKRSAWWTSHMRSHRV